MAVDRSCESCRFLGPEEPAHCRRFPPVAIDGTNSTFPLVKPEWYCEEHMPNNRKKVK